MRISLSPGERAEILVDLNGMNGQILYLKSYGSELPSDVRGGPPMNMGGTNTMYSPFDGIDFNILQLKVVAQTSNPVTVIPATLVPMTQLLVANVNRTHSITFTAQNMMVMDGPFYFNGLLFDMNRIDFHIPLNNTEIWTLNDQTMVAHPFHLHGVQFQILDRNGNPPPPVERGWKDVVLVHNLETVRFITKFTDFPDPNTAFMYHCHILMHEDDGMMGQFVIVDSTALAVNEISNTQLKVYPNPASDRLNIAVNGTDIQEMQLFNISGELLKSYAKPTSQIDISDLADGIYMLKLLGKESTEIHRFVVLH
jgi:bilirubin oxidase